MTVLLENLVVILAEPSHMQAHLVERMLHDLGVGRVETVESGQSAQERLFQRQAEGLSVLVLSSMYLPDMSGAELVTVMRADTTQRDVPFVLISSETRPQMLEPVRQSGACCILEKPFTPAQLDRALRAALDYLNPEDAMALNSEEVENLKVLLVDDSVASRHHIRRLLEALGVRSIIEAEDGQQAVACLAETMVDLVITDYNMPAMDGRALTEYIRNQSWQSEVPILMVTSEQDQGRLAAVERAGVSAICDKPFDPGSVRRLIEQALAG